MYLLYDVLLQQRKIKCANNKYYYINPDPLKILLQYLRDTGFVCSTPAFIIFVVSLLCNVPRKLQDTPIAVL